MKDGLARLRLSPSSSDGSVTLTITDAVSNGRIVEMEVTAADFMASLAGRETKYDGLPCRWGRVDRIGWHKANVTVWVKQTKSKSADTKRMNAVANHLADVFGGEWSPRGGDLGNYHKRRGADDAYRCVFFGLMPPGAEFDLKAMQAEALAMEPFGKRSG